MLRPDDYADGDAAGARQRTVLGGGVAGWLRWFWRQLSSMRVALFLLLLLAVAAIPGSLVPQRLADPNGVATFKADHPDLFKVLDAFPIQAFDVYSSVWFSATYLLLFVSLVACIVPRILHHARALRTPPPKTPARLQRMAGFTQLRLQQSRATAEQKSALAEKLVAEAEKLLRRGRYRTVRHSRKTPAGVEVSVSAERGYLRETGNLLFHIGLVGVLLAVAIGSGYKFTGQKALVEGDVLLNSLIDYDSATSGRFFSATSMDPFRVQLQKLEVDYFTPDDGKPNALGQVKEYRARVAVLRPDGSVSRDTIKVNHPLSVDGGLFFLLANGYAPKIVIRNAAGEVVFSENVLFIAQDQNMTSLGVVKVPHGITRDGKPTQLGLRGFFYPTAAELESGALTSNYPDLTNPVLTLDVFAGDLGINSGIPQSVYALDTSGLEQLTGRQLATKSLRLGIGETVALPDGLGSISFESAPRFAVLDVMRDLSARWVLVFALLSVAGLLVSLFVPRRRMWVKAVVDDAGVVLQYAALARGDDPRLESATEQLRQQHRESFGI